MFKKILSIEGVQFLKNSELKHIIGGDHDTCSFSGPCTYGQNRFSGGCCSQSDRPAKPLIFF